MFWRRKQYPAPARKQTTHNPICSPLIMPDGVLAVTVKLSLPMPRTLHLRLSCLANSMQDACQYSAFDSCRANLEVGNTFSAHLLE